MTLKDVQKLPVLQTAAMARMAGDPDNRETACWKYSAVITGLCRKKIGLLK